MKRAFSPVVEPVRPENRLRVTQGRFSSAIALLLVTLFSLPLIIDPRIFLSFDDTYLVPRLYWLYGAVLPASLLVLFNWTTRWHGLRPWGIVLLGMLGWLTLGAVAHGSNWAQWWGNPDRADGVLMHVLYGLLALAGWRWATQDSGWQFKLTLAALLGGGLTALTSVLQQLHLMGVPNGNALTGVSATPFGGTLGNRGYMGGAMALMLPLGLWGLGQFKDLPRLLPWAIGANVLMVWALLGSNTRGAWLAGAGAVAMWWWLSRRQRPRGWKVSLLGGLALFATTAYAFSFSQSSTSNVREFGRGDAGITGSSGRKVLWNSALIGIQQKPLLGWGAGGLYRVMNTRSPEVLFQESGLQGQRISGFLNKRPEQAPLIQFRYPGGRPQFMPLNINKVHNEYLDYALTYGLPAAVLFVGLLMAGMWQSAWAAPGICGALVGYALYLMTWPDVIRFAPIAWFILGIALAQRYSPSDLHPPPHQHHQP